ncbi:MAG: DUF92 domain-containing protein [Chloroflexota bacterium]|nr:DUF92 domain-containing protein [Chloroflexota bacterium]
MTGRDWLGLAISFIYPVLLLIVAETIRRRAGWPPEFTRKLVHIGAGMWVFGALALFDHYWAALIATSAFIGINALSARRSLIPAMDAARSAGLGTVWFMVSFTLLLVWFGSAGRPYLAAAALMALTWGDSVAALVGQRWGRHRYRISGQTRSLEGSAAGALATFVTVGLTLGGLAPALYSPERALTVAALAGVVAMLLEPAAPSGQDNLSIPVGVAVVLWLLDTGRVSPTDLALGLALSALIAGLAYRTGSLTPGGVLGAILTGTATFAFGGLAWGLTLIAFFVASSALGRVGGRSTRKQTAAQAFAKGGQRDLGQALANGGVAALLATGVAAASPAWGVPLFAAFVGSLAAVTADTWATELGVLSRSVPRLVTTGRRVVPGTSGAVSGMGLLAAAAGALFIGLMAWLLGTIWPTHGTALPGGRLLLAALIGGMVGALFDSLLGATVQAVYWCPTCGRETERRVHSCGTPTRLYRGHAWADNETVNLGCALVGALVGGALALL